MHQPETSRSRRKTLAVLTGLMAAAMSAMPAAGWEPTKPVEFVVPAGTGGEPPKTYQNTVKLGLEDPRIHALILGYWHTIVTPPMVFAQKMVEVVDEMRAKGIHKPVVVSLAGDVQVEEAAEHLFAHGIPAYPYTTETPVAVLGAKYKWARGAGLI